MPNIQLSKDDKQQLVEKLKTYCAEELDRDLGGFEADFMLDFIAKEMGNIFYNQGLYDAQARVSQRADEIADAILDLEK